MSSMSTFLFLMLLLCCLAMAAAASALTGGDMDDMDGILHVPSNAELAHCPSRCGDVDIVYPFGIGPGCFRQGFELTCHDHHTLFLGNSTIEIQGVGYNRALASIGPSDSIDMGPGVDTYNVSLETPVNGVINLISGYSNSLYVLGCGVGAYLFDHDTNNFIGSCMSACLDDRETMEKNEAPGDGPMPCNGKGCCGIGLEWDRRPLLLRIDRLPDGSGNDASTCLDTSSGGGYYCQCQIGDGNPYTADGCTAVYSESEPCDCDECLNSNNYFQGGSDDE